VCESLYLCMFYNAPGAIKGGGKGEGTGLQEGRKEGRELLCLFCKEAREEMMGGVSPL